MNNIRVHTESPYEILVGSGLLRSCGQEITKVHAPCRAAIITDDTVDSLYGAQTEASLRAAGYQVCKFVFAHGERSKCLQTALDAYEMLTANGISRSDLIVALGGGVVGDLAGFVAATYLRGVDFVQIPTTFLAAIDSSVGGKTAVDIPSGKNLVGAFWQPKQVICDTDTLSTLSEEIFSEGTAEAIKYGAILDESLYRLLASGGLSSHLEEVICRCVDLKRMLVEEDERDRGSRQLLNFGHTLGHCVETLSGYTVPHGRAVAIGMAMITRVSESLGHRICSRFSIPTGFPASMREPRYSSSARWRWGIKSATGTALPLFCSSELAKPSCTPSPCQNWNRFFPTHGIDENWRYPLWTYKLPLPRFMEPSWFRPANPPLTAPSSVPR